MSEHSTDPANDVDTPVTLQDVLDAQRAAVSAMSELTSEYGRMRRAVELIGGWTPGGISYRGTSIGEFMFPTLRRMLATLCDPAFATLTYERAAELAKKPKHGTIGPEGIAARWAADCGAFGSPKVVSKRFHDAVIAGKPQRRARRSKK